MSQSGKMSNAASPPFATKDGAPAGQGTTSNGAHDFSRDPKAGGGAGGEFDITKQNRPQTMSESERPADAPHLRNRPQGGPPPSYDTQEKEIPEGGRYIRDSASVSRQGAGSVGNNRPPFRVKGG